MKHLDEAELQTYIDGELSPAYLKDAKQHFAICANCAARLEEIKAETLQVCALFTHENHSPVPSARLRQNLDAAIAQIDARPSRYAQSVNASPLSLSARLSALFSGDFFISSRAALAGFAVAVICAAIFVALQRSQNDEPTASVKPPALSSETFADKPESTVPIDSEPELTLRVPDNIVKAKRNAVSHSQTFRHPKAQEDGNRKTTDNLLPGEVSYLNAIASLTDVVESNSRGTLSPSLRVEYERNLAVVNEAITTTRTTAKRNPNDSDAAQFLFSAYQSKIELLNAVADQREIAQR